MAAMPAFAFDNSYARELPGHAVAVTPATVPFPRLLYLNRALADELGLDAEALAGDDGAAIFAGNRVPDGATPIAQAYAGHEAASTWLVAQTHIVLSTPRVKASLNLT